MIAILFYESLMVPMIQKLYRLHTRQKNGVMLSRAARNAYSWWWASHIRTKQSKWLDQNLLDMEEKVEYILKIITEDGDSFRVRAEQYYRKRPELVNFVEDTFRGYRALAERYDHLSRDLQSANRTIAMIFPERVQMLFDDDDGYEDITSNFDEYETMVPANLPLPPKLDHLPKMGSVVHAILNKKSKMPAKMMSKKGLMKIGFDENASKVLKSSGLSKDEAFEEIDKLQKEILEFQIEKELVKSSYQSELSKYWEIENKISKMHTKISDLQHEFAVGGAINDHDAQTLMSSFALKMCKETLDKLKRKQKRFETEAVVEHHRVDEIRKKFEALITRTNSNTDLKKLEETNEAKIEEKELKSLEENGALIQQEETLGSNEEISISEVAEKIEELVDKVINLETDLTSQTALVIRLRFEIDELHEKLQRLEQEKNNLVDESNNMGIKIKKLEEELGRVQMLDKKINVQNVQLETSFDEAIVSVDNLSKDLLIAKPDDDIKEGDASLQEEKENTQQIPRILEEKGNENQRNHSDDLEDLVKKPNVEQDEPKRKVIFTDGIEDREKMLLEEYTSTLENFKEVKQKLNETEKRNRARSFKSAVQMKMLRSSNESKDAEIRSLHEKLKQLELRKGPDLGDEGTEEMKELEKVPENELIMKASDVDDEGAEDTITEQTRTEYDLDESTDIELTKASNAIDEGTHRIEELVETAHFELKRARELINEGTQRKKEPDETIGLEQPMKFTDLVDEGTERSKELDENTDFELKKAQDSVNEETVRRKEQSNGVDDANERLEIEEEIHAEIDHLRKENLELWLRFSTSYHQINRFQDSFHDLLQEIKQVKEKKHEDGSGKQRHHHHHSAFSSEIRPLYRHLLDMQTEVILWLEKSGILEDDLQHRLTSLSDIQNELSDLTNDASETEKTNVQLNNYQAAKFQGEVLNMKQENVKVLDELREASARVRTLQFNIEKTLSVLDEEVGQINRSNTGSKVPFKSILFGSKLRRKHKHKHSLFTCMSPSLQRQYSNIQELPQPREDTRV